MFGIEELLVDLLGNNSLLIMLAGFFLLIILNLFTRICIEFKKNDLNWNDLPEFIQPVVLYTVFLVGLDLLVVTGKGMPVIHELFQGLQVIGYVSVMAKYFKKFYSNLKELGMPTDSSLDGAFEEKLDGLGQETKDQVHQIIEEYLASKRASQPNETEVR